MMKDEALLVFARHPEKGKVKTRLARGIGDTKALAVYEAMLAATLLLAHAQAKRGRAVGIWVDPPDRLETFRGSWGKDLDCRPQPQGPLGERLAVAEAETRREGASRVVLIGSDCPQLEERHLEEAFATLRTAPSVLGPALDGGYYLIGLSREIPGIFEGIPWSTPAVLARTLEKLERSGIRPELLETLSDVDEAKDLVKEART